MGLKSSIGARGALAQKAAMAEKPALSSANLRITLGSVFLRGKMAHGFPGMIACIRVLSKAASIATLCGHRVRAA